MMKEYKIDGNIVRIELEDGRKTNIAKDYLDRMVSNLDIDMEEAILTWLEDEGYLTNDEQEELCVAAKQNKVLSDVRKGTRDIAKGKKKTERKVKENPTKEMIIAEINKTIAALNGVENVVIENKSKIITFDLNGESYKIDLIQRRKKNGV